MNKPVINVTPLIDLLLVLLIIFMVVAPLKPSSFKTRIPSEPQQPDSGILNPDTIVVAVGMDLTLNLNSKTDVGSTIDTSILTNHLREVFRQRIANGNVSASFADDPDRTSSDRIERTVFIKAPRTIGYGTVARVVDAVKLAGAYPISLQIDAID